MSQTQNGVLKKDDDFNPVMGGTSSADNVTIINAAFDPVTRRLLTDSAGGGTGTVTSVSVVSANGFAGTVATATTTPAITLTTTITSNVLKGNGTAIIAAVAGTDYQIPITLTTTGTSGAATFNAGTGALNIPNYAVSGSGLTVGTTTITSGTTTRILFDNAGVLGEYTITGSGNVVMSTGASFSGATITTSTLNGVTLTTGGGTTTFLNANGAYSTPAGTGVTSVAQTVPAFLSISGSPITTTGTLAIGLSGTALPIANGGTGVTSVTTAPAVTAFAGWDASKNLSANNFLAAFTTTATAAGTTALTITSTEQQVFTGVTTQIVTLPTTGVVAGGSYTIINKSTGLVTVQSSGANTITILGAGTSAVFTALVATPTTAANWNSQYFGDIVASGKVLTVSNSITLAGTDGTTMTFPSTSATVYTTATGSITSAQLATSLTDETGTGAAVFGTKPTFVGTIQTIVAVSALALDGSLGNVFTKTIGSPSTFTQSNFSTGQLFMFKITGAFTPTWFSGITWITVGGTAPTQGAITTYGFLCTGSNTFDGYLVGTQ